MSDRVSGGRPTAACRARAVRLVQAGAWTVGQAAQEHRVRESTIRKWVREADRSSLGRPPAPPIIKSGPTVRRLYPLTAFLFLPALAIRAIGFALGWPFLPQGDELGDSIVSWLFTLAFLYYGFVVHVMPDYFKSDTWLRHLFVAVPLMAAAITVETLHSSQLIPKLLASWPLHGGLSALYVKLLDWVVGGVVGNAAYAIITRVLKRAWLAGGNHDTKA